jgi:hypothetical protein
MASQLSHLHLRPTYLYLTPYLYNPLAPSHSDHTSALALPLPLELVLVVPIPTPVSALLHSHRIQFQPHHFKC